MVQDHAESVRIANVGGNLLLMAGFLAAPVVIAGYVGLTVLFSLPLLGLRRMLPRRSMQSARRRDAEAPVGHRWSVATTGSA